MDPNNFPVKIHEISLSFDDFERILHPWRQQSNTGNDKNERVLFIFASRLTARVFDHCKTGLRIFHDYFLISFDDFQRISNPWREQSNAGNDKSDRDFRHFHGSVDGVRF